VDCAANAWGQKHANLDICLGADDLAAIPHSANWVYLLDPGHLSRLDDATRAKAVSDGHARLIREIRGKEKVLTPPTYHNDLGLYYALEAPAPNPPDLPGPTP